MYPPGHVGLTALLFAPLICWFRLRGRRAAATECLGVALALAVLPDIDKVWPGLVHRGVTHTLLAAMIAGVLVVLLFRAPAVGSPGLGGEHPAVCYLVGAAGVVSHLVGDVITPMGIQPLFPASRAAYSLDIVQASSTSANVLLVVVGAAALVCSYRVPVSPPVEAGGAEESARGRPLSDQR
ncbi:metal-dependent hydrolase [Haloarcula salinisoli]|uniref:Metal-dependent hydrolase n=1 Tax=Haloarcula salinisoli TaxID=2487746 RepID=A0A8J7YKP4_9EURY|nr:metal-dependent hydrolase [Halomicroarcula salinisoli]MBX0303576.1 metal-dependent hydrolase [Halomicroarcula salinisoli]